MFPWNPSQWTEAYLQSLISQPESSRLEFKSGKVLAKKEDKDRFIREHLSFEVSAFANSEGGIIIIGMDEDKDTKPRLAKELDGIVIGSGNAIESPEQFNQLLNSCVSPFLPGLAVQRVRLSGSLAGRTVIVVHVPQGSTAYQAKDYKYYSRSEFESKPMPDHEVRLRMQRGRVPQARLEIAHCELITAEQEFQRRQTAMERELQGSVEGGFLVGRRLKFFKSPKRGFDDIAFELAVVNSGELTIRDFMLRLVIQNRGALQEFTPEEDPQIGEKTRMRFGEEICMRFPLRGVPTMATNVQIPMLFPEDRIPFPPNRRWISIAAGSALTVGSLFLVWTIYLDDAPPISGEMDLYSALQLSA